MTDDRSVALGAASGGCYQLFAGRHLEEVDVAVLVVYLLRYRSNHATPCTG